MQNSRQRLGALQQPILLLSKRIIRREITCETTDEERIANLGQIEGCDGHWIRASLADDGTYTVNLNGGQVFVTSANPAPAGAIASFDVDISAPPPGPAPA